MTTLYKYLRTKRHHALRRIGAKPMNVEETVGDGEVPHDIRAQFNKGAYKVTVDFPDHELIYERLEPFEGEPEKKAG